MTTANPTLPASGPTVALSLEAWADLDEDEPGELVDGRIVEEEMPSVLHETVVAWLILLFGSWARPRGGKVYASELKLALGPGRGRKPDVSLYLPGAALPHRHASLVTQPPSLVVEVLSPRPRDVRRDKVDKLQEYARFGVRFFWIVDPERRVLECLELGADGRYVVALTASAGLHTLTAFEGLTLDLDALWSEIDALPDDAEVP